ncbi:MAG: hypothetical protein OXJ55_18675 [Caldilineaceae bacterium]|nr:hypothetical protein [Caldilineaceae bacterium]
MTEVSGNKDIKVIPQKDWDARIEERRQKSRRLANEIRENGDPLKVEILSTNVVKSGDEVQLASVVLELDEALAGKLEMIQKANEFVTAVYLNNGSYSKNLLTVLEKTIRDER